jgi:hypothetical protein
MRNGGACSRGTAYAYEPHEDSDSNTERRCKENGADKVMLFPVYERKIKEGKEVFKVRMVDQHIPQCRREQKCIFCFMWWQLWIGNACIWMSREFLSLWQRHNLTEPIS